MTGVEHNDDIERIKTKSNNPSDDLNNFFSFIYLHTSNFRQPETQTLNKTALTRQTIRSQLLHTPTDRQRQLVYGRCRCMQVLYIPRGGSAQTLNYMGAKAIKTEICS